MGLDWQIWLPYAAIPVISGVMGWGTNWMAIRMAFYPIEFKGVLPPFIGWQGLIPRQTTIMARRAAKSIMGNLITVDELFDKIQPYRIADELQPYIPGYLEDVAERVMQTQAPKLWMSLPGPVKRTLYQSISKDAVRLADEIVCDVQENIEDLFDVESLLVNAFERDKALLVRMFSEIGSREFKLLEISGLWLGILFGVIQMAVWIFYPAVWVLPLFGFLVGIGTNWIAIKLIFEPHQPVKVGPWTLQGAFVKRQPEASHDLAVFCENEVLTADNIIRELLQGPASNRLYAMVERHLLAAFDDLVGRKRPLLVLGMGGKKFSQTRDAAIDAAIKHLPDSLRRVRDYSVGSMQIKDTLEKKFSSLPPEDFVGILRPAVEEDEWMLVAVGGGLGALVGLGQLVLLFGHSLF